MKAANHPPGALKQVVQAAVGSRLLVLTLAVLLGAVIPNFDQSAGLITPCTSGSNFLRPSSTAHLGDDLKPRFPLLARTLESAYVWDAVHFLQLAKCGYEYENQHAFFPAFPWTIRAFYNHALYPLDALIGQRATLALAALLISNASFLIACIAFYKLTCRVLPPGCDPLQATLLFAFNPASVFYSLAYTESLYAACALSGLYLLFSAPTHNLQSNVGRECAGVLLLSIAGGVRSNGVTHLLFIAHRGLQKLLFCFLDAAPRVASSARPKTKPTSKLRRFASAIYVVLQTASYAAALVLPLAASQYFAYMRFCASGLHDRPWCKATLPNLYSYVQANYWSNGLFRYWKLQQLPNFLLAAPVLLLSFSGAWTYFGSKTLRQLFTLCLLDHDSDVFPFKLHWFILSCIAFFCMHVEVSTRFLSACPALFWFASNLASKNRLLRATIVFYLLLYIGLGCLLHINFYPWT